MSTRDRHAAARRSIHPLLASCPFTLSQMVRAPEEPVLPQNKHPVLTDGPLAAARVDELRRSQPAAALERPIMWHNQIKGWGGGP